MKFIIPGSAVIFWAGIQNNRIDDLYRIWDVAHAEEIHRKDLILDTHGRLCKIEESIKNIEHHLKCR